MKNIFKRLMIGFVLLAAGFASGTVFGFLNGIDASFYIDAAPRGSTAALNLKALDSGNLQGIKISEEAQVDNSLYLHSMLIEAWWFPVYRSGWLPADPSHSEEFIRQVATYRYNHPTPFPDTTFDTVPKGKEQMAAQYQEMAQGLKGFHHRVNDVVEKYADKQPQGR